jgi:plasmid stabilization system protein ParE
MAVKLILAPEALQDLDEIMEWYEAARNGLSVEFLNAVGACLALIARNPKLFASVDENTRRALVRRFPYAIYFELEPERVLVYAVLHTSRNPQTWQTRPADPLQ